MKTILKSSLLILIFLLAGCASDSSAGEPLALTQEFESAVGTAIVETIAAAIPTVGEAVTQVPTIFTPDSSSTPEVIYAPSTTASGIQFTPTATGLPTPCYLAELVDETIPDGTVLGMGEGFIKIWNIRNAGVCEWTEDFRWVLTDGRDFRGPTNFRLGKSVMPGEILQIALELSTPSAPDNYEAIYKIETEDGALVTPNGFWIRIVVVETEEP